MLYTLLVDPAHRHHRHRDPRRSVAMRTEDLIDLAMHGNYGLARLHWVGTLRWIGALPETA